MATLDNFSNEVIRTLRLYGDNISEGMTKESKRLAIEGVNRLKVTSPKRKGLYARAWKFKKRGKIYVLYNSNYRLTHLLEKKHKKKNGKGFTTAQPHIKPVETQIVNEFKDYVEGLIRNGNRP